MLARLAASLFFAALVSAKLTITTPAITEVSLQFCAILASSCAAMGRPATAKHGALSRRRAPPVTSDARRWPHTGPSCLEDNLLTSLLNSVSLHSSKPTVVLERFSSMVRASTSISKSLP